MPTMSIGGSGALPTVAPTSGPVGREVPTFTVQRGDIVDKLLLAGRVAGVEEMLSFSESGFVSAVYVERGSVVEKGQLLAELDSSDLAVGYAQAQAEYTQRTVAVQRNTEAGGIGVERAKLALEAAWADLEKAKLPPTREEILAAEVAVRQSETALGQVRHTSSQTKNLAKEAMDGTVAKLTAAQASYVLAQEHVRRVLRDDQLTEADRQAARQNLINAEAAMQAAEAEVRAAVINYDTARNNEVEVVRAAEADLELARANLEALHRGADPFEVGAAERDVREAEIALREAQLNAKPDPSLVSMIVSAESELKALERQMENRKLFAPEAGEILAVELSPGVTAAATSPIMILSPGDQREIIAELPTTSDALRRSTRLTIGQEVELTFSRFPGQTFTGMIARLPSRAADGLDAGPSEMTYAISFDTSSISADINDLVDVRALIGRSTNALWLPPEAIRTSRDRSFVLLQSADGEERVDIEVGLSSADRVEILRGLKEGDVVVGVASSR